MLRTALLCLMLTLSEELDQDVVERVSYKLGLLVSQCHEQLQMEQADLDRYIVFWSDEFDFDVWYDGCLALCVLQRMGLIDRHNNFIQSHAMTFAQSSGANDEQTLELYDMVTRECVIPELMSELPEVNQPNECVRPMLYAICFRRGIIEAMQPDYRRQKYTYKANVPKLETLYSKLFQLFSF